jgi:hypothetical protein
VSQFKFLLMDPKLPFTKTLADCRVGWKAVIRSSRLKDAKCPRTRHSL